MIGKGDEVSEGLAVAARTVVVQTADQALAGEMLEVHGRFTVADQITMVSDSGTHARTASVRSMVAIRSFARGHVGFSYTTDVTSAGLNRAIRAARASRTFALAPPTPGLPVTDDGRWEDRSAALAQFEVAWDAHGLGAELVLGHSRTTVIHARSDSAPVEYSEGSSSAMVNRGLRTEVAWSRELDVTHLGDLLKLTATRQEKPWSLAHHPMIFVGSAGAALTAIILRGLTGSPSHLATKVAARLPDDLCVIDDASDPDGPAGGPFDAEGWPTMPQILAQRGELGVDPALWGQPSRASGPHGLSWRRDLARPPVLAPSNVALVARTPSEATPPGNKAWMAKLDRGLVCDSVTIGALSFDVRTGAFAAPCSGRLVRGGEVTERRVRGVLQGSVVELAAGILDVRPFPAYVPLACGIRTTDVFVAHGVSLRSG